MATKYASFTVCDLCDTTGPVTSCTFGFREEMFTLDLCRMDEVRLGQTLDSMGRRLSRYIESAEVAVATHASKNDMSHVRKWARENGYDVSDRGRLSFEIHEAYAAAQGN